MIDFGSGWGRITRTLLTKTPATNLYALDVDDRMTALLNTTLPGVNAMTVNPMPPTPLATGAFDGVVAFRSSHCPDRPTRHGRLSLPGWSSLAGLPQSPSLTTCSSNRSEEPKRRFAAARRPSSRRASLPRSMTLTPRMRATGQAKSSTRAAAVATCEPGISTAGRPHRTPTSTGTGGRWLADRGVGTVRGAVPPGHGLHGPQRGSGEHGAEYCPALSGDRAAQDQRWAAYPSRSLALIRSRPLGATALRGRGHCPIGGRLRGS